jgi:hypothetical protein
MSVSESQWSGTRTRASNSARLPAAVSAPDTNPSVAMAGLDPATQPDEPHQPRPIGLQADCHDRTGPSSITSTSGQTRSAAPGARERHSPRLRQPRRFPDLGLQRQPASCRPTCPIMWAETAGGWPGLARSRPAMTAEGASLCSHQAPWRGQESTRLFHVNRRELSSRSSSASRTPRRAARACGSGSRRGRLPPCGRC